MARRRRARGAELARSPCEGIADSVTLAWRRIPLPPRSALRQHFAPRGDVYVAGNNFLYYEEGKPRSVVSPDVYVVFGIAPHLRRVYKLWEEGHVPAVVVEVSSRKTWRQDLGEKRDTFARLGVAEYWLYDPERDYLDPPLQGFSLTPDGYAPIAPDARGRIRSTALGLDLDLDAQGRIRLVDPAGGRLPRTSDLQRAVSRAEASVAREAVARLEAEATAARETAARAEAEATAARETAARADAEATAARETAARAEAEATAARESAARSAAEAEVERLRAEIERLRGGPSASRR